MHRLRFSLAHAMLVILVAAVVFATVRLLWEDPALGVVVAVAAVLSSAGLLMLARRLGLGAEQLPRTRSAAELVELVRHPELGSISLLTVHEVAQLLRCHPRKVEQLVERGRLAYVDFAPGGGHPGTRRGSWRFRPSAIQALLDDLETTRTPADARHSRPVDPGGAERPAEGHHSGSRR